MRAENLSPRPAWAGNPRETKTARPHMESLASRAVLASSISSSPSSHWNGWHRLMKTYPWYKSQAIMNPTTQPLGQDAFWLNLRHEKSHPASRDAWEWNRLTGMDSWLTKSFSSSRLWSYHDASRCLLNECGSAGKGRKGQNNPLIVIVNLLLFYSLIVINNSLIINNNSIIIIILLVLLLITL